VTRWLGAAAVVAAAACAASGRPQLATVSMPDVSHVDPGVQAQVRDRYDALQKAIANRQTSDADLSAAYGSLGMVLQAAEFYDAAEPCYLNAQALAPGEIKWPYYLASLYKSKGDTSRAEASYARALQIRPDDVATLVWLGRLDLDLGRSDDAQARFSKALTVAPNTTAAQAGLGRVALTRRDFAGAAKHLEQALADDPDADSLHAPLAAAYQGLGETGKAAPHLRQWRNRDVFVPDPLQQDLDLLLESGLSYELRGVRAFDQRDWKLAGDFFRKGLTLTKENTPLARSLHHKLGTALFLQGDAEAAEEQFAEVVRQAPGEGVDESTSKAHYSLALLLEERGKGDDALGHFAAAVRYQPNYAEAHLAYGDALRRSGQYKAALAEYDEALAISPRSTQARLGHAIALSALGRWREVRDWLVESSSAFPDRAEYTVALARVLAAAPDAGVRDGNRAIALSQQLLQQQKSTDVGETYAMALAELGDFGHAVGIQRGVIAAARQAGLQASVERMTVNLARYERREPSRRPWPFDLPVVLSEAPATVVAKTVGR
jgi:tetratricopeptide (TPR) repeat protein